MNRNEPKLTPYRDALDVSDMPLVVPASAEQCLYVASLVRQMLNVLLQRTPLEDAERTLFGQGKYFWPKDPKQPIRTSKFYDPTNFRVSFVSLSFARQDQTAAWTGASLAITPKSFPRSAYKLAVPADLFSGMTLKATHAENRAANGSAPARQVHVFEFLWVDGGITLNLQFESRDDLSNLKAPYPATFDLLRVKRVGGG